MKHCKRMTDGLMTNFFCDENMVTSFCLLCGNFFSLGSSHKQIIHYQAVPVVINMVSGSTEEKMLDWALLGTPIQAIVGFSAHWLNKSDYHICLARWSF